MSSSGPNTLVVVGTTDYWDNSARNSNVLIDGRQRRASTHSLWGTQLNYWSISGKKARTPSAVPAWLEWTISAGETTASGVGVGLVSTAQSNRTNVHGQSGSVVMMDGSLYISGSSVQNTGVTLLNGDRIGVKVWLENDVSYAQFYRNGIALTSAHVIPTVEYQQVAVLLASNQSRTVVMFPDFDDQLTRPDDSAPWGAAARVADAGGESPAPNLLVSEIYSANFLDPYFKVLRNTASTTSTSAAGSLSRGDETDDRLLAIEFVNESNNNANHIIVGFVREDENWLGSLYPGQLSSNYGASMLNPTVYNNNVGTTFTGKPTAHEPESRLVLIWQPSTGKVWVRTNDTAWWSGDPDPDVNTTPSFTMPVGRYRPAVYARPSSTGSVAKVRICSHEFEMRYRPSFAEAYDGAGVLPAQHFKGLLGNDPYVDQSIWLPQWGGSPKRGAPMGAMEVINVDGLYDHASAWPIRDEDLTACELDRVTDVPQYVVKGRVDSLETRNGTTLRVLMRSASSKLELRNESQIFVVGTCFNIPLMRTNDAAVDRYVAGQRDVELMPLSLHDAGVNVTTWEYSEQIEYPGSIVRTTAINGVHTATVNVRHWTLVTTIIDTDFASGVSFWNKTNSGANSDIAASPAGQLTWTHVAGTNPAVQISSQYLAGSPSLELKRVDVVVTSYTSGDLLWSSAGSSDVAGITGVGTYRFKREGAPSGVTLTVADPVNSAAQLTIDRVDIYTAADTNTPRTALDYLASLTGMTAYDYHVQSSFNSSASTLGHYSKNQPTYLEVLEEMLSDWMADFYPQNDGRLYIGRPTTSPELSTAELSVVEADFIGEPEVEDDTASGLSDGVMVGYNWSPMSDDQIAGSVTGEQRSRFQREYSEMRLGVSPHEADSLDPFYAHARGAPPHRQRSSGYAYSTHETLTLVSKLWGVKRCFIRGTVKMSKARQLRPFQVVDLSNSRYGLSAGRNAMVVSVKRRLTGASADVTFWLAAEPPAARAVNVPPPAASFSWAQNGSVPNAILDGTGSYDVDGEIIDWSWDFGDGQYFSGWSKLIHGFPAAGTYNVTLTVTDDRGATASVTKAVTVTGTYNTAPIPNITVVSNNASTGYVSVNANGTTDPDGDAITEYRWTWGDNSGYYYGSAVEHQYTLDGTYGVTLRVRDAQGGYGQTTTQIVVTGSGQGGNELPNQPPVSVFTYTTDALALSVDATNSYDLDGSIVSYTWDWGDGTATGSGVLVDHTYAAPGAYIVTLTVADDDSAQHSSFTTVSVDAAMPAYTRLRVQFTETWGGPAVQLAEIDFKNSTPASVAGTNSATSGTAANATDANSVTYWEPSLSDSAPTFTRVFANAATCATVAQLSLTYATLGGGSFETAPLAFIVQASIDGSSWTTISTITDAPIWTEGETRTYALDLGSGSGNVAPVAAFTSTVTGLSVAVDGSSSTDSDGTVVTYSWDWGDSTAAGSGATALHTYAADGTYTITLTVTDDLGATDTATDDVIVSALGGGTADRMRVKFTETWGAPAVQIAELRFTDGTTSVSGTDSGSSGTASNAFDGSNATYWEPTFSDADPALTRLFATPSLLYSVTDVRIRYAQIAAGAFEAAPRSFLIQISSDGSSWTTIKTVSDEAQWAPGEERVYPVDSGTAANAAPIASFTHSSTGGVLDVDGTGSSDPDGSITSYAWSWGDGSSNGSGSTAQHTYAVDGSYTVTLTVTDNLGTTHSLQQTVTISGSAGGSPSGDRMRVIFDETWGAPAVQIAEVSFLAGATPVSGTNSASSGTAARAFDTDNNSYWEPAFSDSAPALTRTFADAATLATVTVVKIRYANLAAGTFESSPRSFRIQKSSDGTSWTTLQTVTDASAWTAGEERSYSI